MKYSLPLKMAMSLALSTGLLFTSQRSSAAVIYNFDSLSLGSLTTTSNTGGQDGWYRDAALGGPDLQVITAPGGSPTSQAISVAYGNTSERAIRQFGTNFFNGTETNAQISFTFEDTSLTTGIQMTLGNGSTPTTYINGNVPGDFAPRLLFSNNKFGIQPKTTSGNFGTISQSSAQSLTLGDWYTVTMSLDFTANGGDGSGSISYLNVTTGVSTLNVLTGVDLGLLNNSVSTGPSDWNQVSIRMDQLTTGGPSGTSALSGFEINAAPVPEPSSIGLLVIGLSGVMLGRRRLSIGK